MTRRPAARSSLRLLPGALAAGVAMLVAGCEKSIDTGSLQSRISELIAQQGTKPKSVRCPDDIVAQKGKVLDCTVTAPNGRTQKAVVTLTNGDGGFTVVVEPTARTPAS